MVMARDTDMQGTAFGSNTGNINAKKTSAKEHRMLISNREKAGITGVNDVVSFDPDEVILEIDTGILNIKGSNLHVNRLSVDKGELDIDGKIDSITYSDSNSLKRRNESLVSRLFR